MISPSKIITWLWSFSCWNLWTCSFRSPSNWLCLNISSWLWPSAFVATDLLVLHLRIVKTYKTGIFLSPRGHRSIIWQSVVRVCAAALTLSRLLKAARVGFRMTALRIFLPPWSCLLIIWWTTTTACATLPTLSGSLEMTRVRLKMTASFISLRMQLSFLCCLKFCLQSRERLHANPNKLFSLNGNKIWNVLQMQYDMFFTASLMQ